MLLHRPEVLATVEELESGYIVKGVADLTIIKNYTGACGLVPLKFDGSTMRFFEPENDYDEWEEQLPYQLSTSNDHPYESGYEI